MSPDARLVLDRRAQVDATITAGFVMLSPPLGEDYWTYRVRLTNRQAVVGFPKFETIGIGFAIEAVSTNMNLPYRLPAAMIAGHIACNKGDNTIPDEAVIQAIQMIRDACVEDGAPSPQGCVL